MRTFLRLYIIETLVHLCLVFTVNLEDGNGEDDDQTHRRSRFLWNKDYDELAQDASAILRVRSRETGARMDWFALNQIFPAVPKNSVRQRVASLRELQSNEIYMRRLEDQWTRLWKQYRGTEHLPDPNPGSQTDFDLIKHLKFLRRFVDKNALCALHHVFIILYQSDHRLEAGRFSRGGHKFHTSRDGICFTVVMGRESPAR